jgi:hypothetical protein
VYADWKEDANDDGKKSISWVTLGGAYIVTALTDNELSE